MDRTLAFDCPTNTPLPPTTLNRITTTTPQRPLEVAMASGIIKTFVCKGSQKIINIPNGYTLVTLNSYYATTPDYTCNTIKYAY